MFVVIFISIFISISYVSIHMQLSQNHMKFDPWNSTKHLRSLYLYTVVLEHGGTNCRVAIRPAVPAKAVITCSNMR